MKRALILALLLCCGIASAQTVYQDDFELGDLAAYQITRPTTVLPATSPVHSGIYSLQSTIASPGGWGGNGAAAYVSNTLTLPNPVYMQFYFYLPSSFALPPGDSI